MKVGHIALGALALGVGASLMRRSSRLDLAGRVVLITGGSRGLGLEMARQFGRQGARLALLARSSDDLERAAEELFPYPVETLACDLRDREQVEEAITAAIGRFGQLDVLVNNAGTIRVGPLDDLDLLAFREEMDVNFFGALHATLTALPHLERSGNGRIVNVTSIGGRLPAPHLLPYVASKFAMAGFSQALQGELAGSGVRVTTVIPGLMRTGSPYRALFGGHQEQEFRWFLAASSVPGISTSAKHAARRIVEACSRGTRVLTVPGWLRLPIALEGIAPATVSRASALANRFLPPPAYGNDRTLREGREVTPPSRTPTYALLTRKAAYKNNELG